MIKGIHHIAINVPHFDQGLAFYRDVIGFEVVEQGRIQNMPQADRAVGLPNISATMAMMWAGSCFVELWSYGHPEGEDKTARPCDLGYPHIALEVVDIQSEHSRLENAGMTFVGPPVDFGDTSAVYGQDPFGNVIEIYEIHNPERAQLAHLRTRN